MNKKSIDELNVEIAHFHNGFAKCFADASVSIAKINFFVDQCVKSFGDTHSSNNLRWADLSESHARKFFDTFFASWEAHERISDVPNPEGKKEIFDHFLGLLSGTSIRFLSNYKWVESENKFNRLFDVGTVIQSKGLVILTDQSVGLLYLAGAEFWSRPKVIISN